MMPFQERRVCLQYMYEYGMTMYFQFDLHVHPHLIRYVKHYSNILQYYGLENRVL